MQQIILILHVLIAFCLIGLILLQQGKGAEVGAAFGGGASQTVFGSQGSSSFLFKLTAGLGLLFLVTSMVLTRMAANNYHHAPKSSLVSPVSHTLPIKQKLPNQSNQQEQNTIKGKVIKHGGSVDTSKK